MTDQSSPITPPLELVQQWLCSHDYLWGPLEQTSMQTVTITANRLQNIATAAAQWGSDQRGTINEAKLQERADQELEACVNWLEDADLDDSQKVSWVNLRAARRPKPPSLKEQALNCLVDIEHGATPCPSDFDSIRRALEALPND